MLLLKRCHIACWFLLLQLGCEPTPAPAPQPVPSAAGTANLVEDPATSADDVVVEPANTNLATSDATVAAEPVTPRLLPSDEIPAGLRIKLQTNGHCRMCFNHGVVITGDGAVTLSNESGRDVGASSKTKRLPSSQVRKLVQLFAEAQFFDIDSNEVSSYCPVRPHGREIVVGLTVAEAHQEVRMARSCKAELPAVEATQRIRDAIEDAVDLAGFLRSIPPAPEPPESPKETPFD